MYKINTTVGTGDKFIFEGIVYEVGNIRVFDGKRLVTLTVSTSSTSCYSIQVSVRKLNQMLKTSEIIT